MLSMGKSKPWQYAFQNLTGYRELTAQPIKDYFQVLYDWMKEQRKKEGYSIGWNAAPTTPTKGPSIAPTKGPKPTTKSSASSLVMMPWFLVVAFCITSASFVHWIPSWKGDGRKYDTLEKNYSLVSWYIIDLNLETKTSDWNYKHNQFNCFTLLRGQMFSFPNKTNHCLQRISSTVRVTWRIDTKRCSSTKTQA